MSWGCRLEDACRKEYSGAPWFLECMHAWSCQHCYVGAISPTCNMAPDHECIKNPECMPINAHTCPKLPPLALARMQHGPCPTRLTLCPCEVVCT